MFCMLAFHYPEHKKMRRYFTGPPRLGRMRPKDNSDHILSKDTKPQWAADDTEINTENGTRIIMVSNLLEMV